MSRSNGPEREAEPFSHVVLRFVLLSVFSVCLLSLFYQFIVVPTLMHGAEDPKFTVVLLPSWLVR